MPFEIRPAKRSNVHLLLGLAGGTGSGKTYTAMRLAAGISGDKRFCVIDTENGRAQMYADFFAFDVVDLTPPFTPDRYEEAILTVAKAGYSVIVVDQFSHEWGGDGGCLDMQEAELDRMAGNDWKKREACKMSAWIKPKGAHKSMVNKLLQINAHLILLFRAEKKIEMVKEDGKWVIVDKKSLTGINGWIPISEKNLPFELTASFLLTADKPGIPQPIKLQEQHKALFPLTVPISEESGRKIAEWATGAAPAQKQPDQPTVGPTLPMANRKPISADKVIAALTAYGTTEAQILYKIGKLTADALDAYEIEQLRSWGAEIKSGAFTAEQIFGTPITDSGLPV